MSELKKMDVVTMIAIAKLVILIIQLWQDGKDEKAINSNGKVKRIAKQLKLDKIELSELITKTRVKLLK